MRPHLAWNLEGNRKVFMCSGFGRVIHKLPYFRCYILEAVNSQLNDASCKGKSKQTTGSRSVLLIAGLTEDHMMEETDEKL